MARLKSFIRGTLLVALVIAFLIVWVQLPWSALAALLVLLIAWLGLTRSGRQAASVSWVALSTLPQRLGAASVIVVGIGGVVGVLVALLAMGDGLQRTLQQTGDEETAIVLRGAATTEISSGISRAHANLVAQKPGIAQDAQGHPLVSAEVVVVANMPRRAGGTDANVEVRGAGPLVWQVRPQLSIVEGRAFTPGLREVVVGRGAQSQFAGLDLGSTVSINRQDWQIVGIFESGDAHESELLGDADSIGQAYRRGSSVQSVTVRLDDPAALQELQEALASDPQLNVEARSTLAYYTAQSENLSRLIRIVGMTVAAIMAVGAVFGALNSMYAAVAARRREIATLRALGFSSLPVVASVLLETMVLALLGGALGGAIAWLVFDNYTASTLGANFSQVVFHFHVSPWLLGTGIKWALAIGFIGGLFPALRAAQLPVSVALRGS